MFVPSTHDFRIDHHWKKVPNFSKLLFLLPKGCDLNMCKAMYMYTHALICSKLFFFLKNGNKRVVTRSYNRHFRTLQGHRRDCNHRLPHSRFQMTVQDLVTYSYIPLVLPFCFWFTIHARYTRCIKQARNFIFEKGKANFILKKGNSIEKSLSLWEPFEGAPRPRPWNSRHGVMNYM